MKYLILLLSTLIGSSSIAQISVTKSWSGNISVDNGNGNPPSVSFVSNVDFPAGMIIESISVSVSFNKVDNTCANPGGGNPFNEEIRFQLRGPGALPTSNRRLINFNDFTSTTNGGSVTMSFENNTALPSFPQTGTFDANQSLAAYEQESPFGSWFVRARDNEEDDPLCYTGYSITIVGNWPLPVTLVNFIVERKNKNNVLLTWETASEINNDYFVVERSIDGLSWNQLDSIEGSGTTNEKQTYSYTDATASSNLFYYRLHQVDFNGENEYSKILLVDAMESEIISGKPKFSILQNPVNNGQLNFYIGYAYNVNYIQIMDITGRIIEAKPYQTENKESIETMTVSNLKPGVYSLVLEDNNHARQSKQFVVR